MRSLNIGVTGYSEQKFDVGAAKGILESAFDYLAIQYDTRIINVVSGLSNIGIPGLAYQIAAKRGYKTVGIAPLCAKEYELYPVNLANFVGLNWGDESQTFLDSIDVLIRIGFGKQSLQEVEMAKNMSIPILEFDLPPLENI